MRARRKRALAQIFISDLRWPWVLADFTIGYVLFYASTFLGKYSSNAEIQFHNTLAAFVFAFFFCLFGLGNGLYERESRISQLDSLRLTALSWLMAVCAGLATLQFVLFIKIGRFALLYGSLGALLGIYLMHYIFAKWAYKHPTRFIVLGKSRQFLNELCDRFTGKNTDMPYVYDDAISQEATQLLDASGDVEEIQGYLEQSEVTSLVIESSAKHPDQIKQLIVRAMQSGIRVVPARRFYAEIYRRYPVDDFSVADIAAEGFALEKPITSFFKRITDIAFAGIAFLLSLPLFLIIAVFVKLSSPGPVFFIQKRQGRHFSEFNMYKFRSMTLNRKAEGDSLVTFKNDARVTWIGKIIRPLHLDELPQLINIIKGDMSLVGPRPAMTEFIREVRHDVPIFEIRQMLRPGLTGLAQISQGYSLDSADEIKFKLGYDLYYVKKYGIMLDLWIMLRTAFTLARSAW